MGSGFGTGFEQNLDISYANLPRCAASPLSPAGLCGSLPIFVFACQYFGDCPSLENLPLEFQKQLYVYIYTFKRY